MSDRTEKLFEDAGGGAPNDVLAVLVTLDHSLQVVIGNLSFGEGSQIKKGSERHLNQFGDLDGTDLKRIGISEDSYEGGDDKFTHCHDIIQGPDDLNVFLFQSYFLKGLPQGCSSQVCIFVVKSPSWK